MKTMGVGAATLGVAAALLCAPSAHAAWGYVAEAAISNTKSFHVYIVRDSTQAAEKGAMRDCMAKEASGCFVLGSTQQCTAAVMGHGVNYYIGYWTTAQAALNDAVAKGHGDATDIANSKGHCGWE